MNVTMIYICANSFRSWQSPQESRSKWTKRRWYNPRPRSAFTLVEHKHHTQHTQRTLHTRTPTQSQSHAQGPIYRAQLRTPIRSPVKGLSLGEATHLPVRSTSKLRNICAKCCDVTSEDTWACSLDAIKSLSLASCAASVSGAASTLSGEITPRFEPTPALADVTHLRGNRIKRKRAG